MKGVFKLDGQVKFFGGAAFPLEMHKVRIVQKLTLVSVEERVAAIREAGSNTFLLKNDKVFLDMLTDSGVNAMSDRQLAAMMTADDSYAGSMSFERLRAVTQDIFGKPFLLPVHQGRAAENILASALVGKGGVVPMNYHFTTTRAHIERNGGSVVELFLPEALNLDSTDPFKGNMDTAALEALLKREAGNVPFVRMEAGTNLIGGQPWSLENLERTSEICRRHGAPLVLDASLLADNLYFIKTREAAQRGATIREITRRIADLCDIVYFSARKLGCARGGAILTADRALFERMQPLIPLFEGGSSPWPTSSSTAAFRRDTRGTAAGRCGPVRTARICASPCPAAPWSGTRRGTSLPTSSSRARPSSPPGAAAGGGETHILRVRCAGRRVSRRRATWVRNGP